MSRLPGPDEQWVESTEGDLDPDLAEEAPYSDWDWEPRGRTWWPALMRVVMVLLIAALVVPALLVALR